MRRLATSMAFVPFLVAATARAEGPRRDDVLSIPLVGLGAHSVGVEAERRVARSWSVAVAASFRKSGGEDYDVTEVGWGAVGRYWLSPRSRPHLAGPFIGARVEWGITHASLHGRSIGNTLRHGESVSFGWRFVGWERVEITPSVGVGARTEYDARGRLAAWTRPEVFRFGTTVGWLF